MVQSRDPAPTSTAALVFLCTVALGSRGGKGLADHLIIAALVNSHLAPTAAAYLGAIFFEAIDLIDPGLMTAHELTLTDLIVTPEFLFAGCTFDNKHLTTLFLICSYSYLT